MLIKVYDLLGRLVDVLFDHQVAPGRCEVVWNGKDLRGRDLPSRTYLYLLEAGSVEVTKRMALVRWAWDNAGKLPNLALIAVR